MLERVQHVAGNAAICVKVLPPFFTAIGLPDAEERSAKLRTRAVNDLVKTRHFKEALGVLAELPERNYKLEAQCYEGTGDLASRVVFLHDGRRSGTAQHFRFSQP